MLLTLGPRKFLRHTLLAFFCPTTRGHPAVVPAAPALEELANACKACPGASSHHIAGLFHRPFLSLDVLGLPSPKIRFPTDGGDNIFASDFALRCQCL